MNAELKILAGKIENRLKFIYAEKYHVNILNSLLEIISNHKKFSTKKSRWDETDVALITYGNSIKKNEEIPLVTLKKFLDKNLTNQVSVVHILPFFPFSSDDGFSVIDFKQVDPDLGTWNEITRLTENFDLMADLVVNHVSSKSKWFKNFINQKGKGSNFVICENPETDLSQVTRPRSSPLLTPYQTKNGLKHVWTTFSADQIDLNFRNPEVLIEMLDILLFYISKGARIIRLDAIAFLWKEPGTTCLHLPQTHEVVKLMRDVSEFINPNSIILTETNVPNKENLSYFGNNDEAHMVYQFSLPPLLLHALHTSNSKYLNQWAKSLPEIPKGCTFFNFTASHDGIGVRPLEGLLPENEKTSLVAKMQEFGGLVNYKTNTDGSKSPYELNITYFDALKGNKHGIDNFQVERFLASQIIMMSFKGMPAFYIHSLTATPNHYQGVEQTKQNRTINRKKWDFNELNTILTSDTPQKKVFESLLKIISIRKKQLAFHPEAKQEILDLGDHIFGLKRTAENGKEIVLIANLTPSIQNFSGIDKNYDLLLGKITENKMLNPYQCVWLADE